MFRALSLFTLCLDNTSTEEKRQLAYTTKILETPMSTYRNKCDVRRIVQGRVARDLVWKEPG